MIQKALHFTHGILDQFIKNFFGLNESSVVLNNIIDANGSVPHLNQNKIVISLINIERETLKPFYVRNQRLPDGNYADISPTERYNLYVLITSNFDNYNETLKFLNAVILFFQTNPSFDSNQFPSFPIELYKLDFNIEKMNYQEMHSLWTSMGAKFQPSIIYKTRLVSIQSDNVKSFEPEISEVSNTIQSS